MPPASAAKVTPFTVRAVVLPTSIAPNSVPAVLTSAGPETLETVQEIGAACSAGASRAKAAVKSKRMVFMAECRGAVAAGRV